MAKGKAKATLLGIQGVVGHREAPDWSFLYETSLIKSPHWNVGDKVVLPGGRTFYYCKSGDVCDTYKANIFYNAIPATGIDYSLLAADAAVGAKSIVMTNQGTVAQTEDGLRGGMINITEGDDGTNQQRGIIGNSAGGVSDEITIYLDAALTAAVTTSWYAYCMPSPFSDVRYADAVGGGAYGYQGFVGYAAVAVTAADTYHWEQTWGQLSCSLYGSALGVTRYFREVVFRRDGNLQPRGASGATGLEAQTAGFILDNNAAANGATVIMLQIIP